MFGFIIELLIICVLVSWWYHKTYVFHETTIELELPLAICSLLHGNILRNIPTTELTFFSFCCFYLLKQMFSKIRFRPGSGSVRVSVQVRFRRCRIVSLPFRGTGRTMCGLGHDFVIIVLCSCFVPSEPLEGRGELPTNIRFLGRPIWRHFSHLGGCHRVRRVQICRKAAD